MRVLQIACGFSYSTVYNNLFSELYRQNVELEVYVPQHKTRSLLDFKDDTFPYPLYSNKIIKKYDKLLYFSKIGRMAKDIELNFNISEISLIHSHSLFSDGGVAFNLYKKYGIPYVVALRDTDLNKYFKYAIHLRRYALEIMKHAAKIIFISPSYKKYVLDKYIPIGDLKYIEDKIEIIPNGINKYWLKNINKNKNHEAAKPTKDKVKVLFVGAINKRKNIMSTIESLEELQKKGYQVKFTVVGRIDDQSIYNQIVNIPFLNYIEPKSKEDLLEIYRDNDIFVMPSITETFGLTYAEAMSQGLPVIYSKGQGFDGQFEEGTVGYHVNCYNSEEISKSIIDIIENYEKFSESCTSLCNKFDWVNICDDYKEVYQESAYSIAGI
ncbi:glycosyltransferase family 4 protein [Piscibacillus sp. B03]|uniref:glycosyltransferase family 4 protein n=1 Tax=Piscibacillus sp. B03 TaxID=3457430 RepID=UPI003FCEB9E4